MGIDLMRLVVGRGKADDIAVACAAIEVIVVVEDDILGGFDIGKADDLDVLQPVVEGEGGAGIGAGGCRLGQLDIGGRDVDLVEQLVAVLQPAHIDEDGEDQGEAEHHRSRTGIEAEAQHAIGHDEHDDGADQCLDDRAAAAAEAVAAEHGRCQSRNLQPHAGIGAGAGKAGGVDRIGGADRAAHGQADIVRRTARTADGHQPPAGPRTRQQDMADDGDDDQHAEGEGNAKEAAEAHQIPGVRLVKTHRHRLGVFQQQHVDDRTHDDQRHQRGEKGTQPQITDENAVEQADGTADQDDGRYGRPHRPAGEIEQRQRHEIAERKIRADRQVDAADDDDQHHGDADQCEFAKLPRGDRQVAAAEEIRDQRAEDDDDADQHQKRNGIVDPLLREDFSDNVVGNEAVSQLCKGVRRRQGPPPCLMVNTNRKVGKTRPADRRPCAGQDRINGGSWRIAADPSRCRPARRPWS